MAMLVRSLGRQCLLRQQSLLACARVPLPASTAMSSSTAYEEMKKYWDKNRKLKRPLSPFLTVYKPHLAMSMSLTHRVTGVAMSVAVTMVAGTLFLLPENYEFYLRLVRDLSLGPIILYSFKYLLAFPVTYHYLNGIRHLAWDAGYGFGLKELYKSGYFVMGLTFLVSSFFVFAL